MSRRLLRPCTALGCACAPPECCMESQHLQAHERSSRLACPVAVRSARSAGVGVPAARRLPPSKISQLRLK